ncbi:uncharacterized protein SPPG_01622 [Spizellomyces punctatus DAOM BR117]|uniref:Rho-GAP domain-containing protein n=1 Tax=Spizellomyces punctatus (strain DAOM BR117) TaxID=645134 RepID=A0A0L0HSV6_SPIPD|nr:uncharacterized protein SPPG_01622 [Spizellomyces punctatus DAOM BR117]KND04188.1 hypothetical protein SPPG_01622 [Spizellomyces punctatus DAOM BR117]|eukprot:XP_016612227.1 hypothetical protein SPPG_01622 [Spizellomyces punctatus DAOM BR117]
MRTPTLPHAVRSATVVPAATIASLDHQFRGQMDLQAKGTVPGQLRDKGKTPVHVSKSTESLASRVSVREEISRMNAAMQNKQEEVARSRKSSTESTTSASGIRRAATVARAPLAPQTATLLASIDTAADAERVLRTAIANHDAVQAAIRDATVSVDAERRAEVRRRKEQDERWERMRAALARGEMGPAPPGERDIRMIMADRKKIDALHAKRRRTAMSKVRQDNEMRLSNIKASLQGLEPLLAGSNQEWADLTQRFHRTMELLNEVDDVPLGTEGSMSSLSSGDESVEERDEQHRPPSPQSPPLAPTTADSVETLQIEVVQPAPPSPPTKPTIPDLPTLPAEPFEPFGPFEPAQAAEPSQLSLSSEVFLAPEVPPSPPSIPAEPAATLGTPLEFQPSLPSDLSLSLPAVQSETLSEDASTSFPTLPSLNSQASQPSLSGQPIHTSPQPPTDVHTDVVKKELMSLIEDHPYVMSASVLYSKLHPSQSRLKRIWRDIKPRPSPPDIYGDQKKRAANKNPPRYYGASLEEMMGGPDPGSSMQTITRDRMPAIMVQLIEWLRAGEPPGIASDGIFRMGIGKLKVEGYRDIIESGGQLPYIPTPDPRKEPLTALHIGGLLKMFFRDLKEPLLTHRLYKPFIKAAGFTDHEKRLRMLQLLVQLLPAEHQAVLQYLLGFLADVVALSGVNRMTSKNVATCFGPNILREKYYRKPTEEDVKEHYDLVEVVSFMIDNHADLWQVPEDVQAKLQVAATVAPSQPTSEKTKTNLMSRFIPRRRRSA